MRSQVQLYLEDLQSYQMVTLISLTFHKTDRIKPLSLLCNLNLNLNFSKENEYFSINQMYCNQTRKIKYFFLIILDLEDSWAAESVMFDTSPGSSKF
jgi:hypothetical protein